LVAASRTPPSAGPTSISSARRDRHSAATWAVSTRVTPSGGAGIALARAVADGLDPVEAGNLAIPGRFASIEAARYELQRSVAHFYAGLEEQELPRIDFRR
jgi:hypothetical protein